MNEQELKVKDVSTETLKKVIEMREADPWAKEREAFERGEKLEYRFNDGGCQGPWVDWPHIFFPSMATGEVRIKPKLKKIDHSMLVGTDVLCQFKDEDDCWLDWYCRLSTIKTQNSRFYIGEDGACYDEIRVAFDIPQVHTGDKCPVPEGYEGKVKFKKGDEWTEVYDLTVIDWSNVISWMATGIAEGWEL